MPTSLAPPIVDDISRRGLLAGLGATALLTACATGPVGPATAAATREVVDGTGRTVVIPADPQRILVISALYDLSQLIDLGFTPFAMLRNSGPTDLMPSALRGVVENAQVFGNDAGEVDAEEILALAPDLILHNTGYGEGIDPSVVQRIAPTVTYERGDVSYEQNLRLLAGWLGGDPEAPVRRWNDRLAELAAELDLGGRSFSIAWPFTDGTFQLYGPDSAMGRVLTALGGSVVPEQVGGAPLTQVAPDLSFEVLPELVAADTVVLVRRYGPGNDEATAEVTANPLWQAVDAVARGDVIEVDVQDSTASHGYPGLERAAQAIADGLTPNR